MGRLAEIDGPDVGVGGDLSGTPGGEAGAAHHHGDLFREPEHQVHVVIDDEHADVPGQAVERVEDDVALRAGYARRGLVEEQHRRLQAEGDGELDQSLTAV